MRRLALRMDDVGASTKRYEVYSNHCWSIGPLTLSGNALFLKYVPPLKAWGPYRELSGTEWVGILRMLEERAARLTVALTATWAVSSDRLVPFPERFPSQAAILKDGVRHGLIEVANHGLTHCVLESNAFKPKWFGSNRQYHREFWDWIPLERQDEHLRRSQEILQTFFETEVVTFVPPGNVFGEATLKIAERHGLRYVCCRTTPRALDRVVVLGEADVEPFHDRDIVRSGLPFLSRLLDLHRDRRFCFVRELAEQEDARALVAAR